LVWLSVWSEVQIVCIFHTHPGKYKLQLSVFNFGMTFLVAYRLARVVLEKRQLNGSSSSTVDLQHNGDWYLAFTYLLAFCEFLY